MRSMERHDPLSGLQGTFEELLRAAAEKVDIRETRGRLSPTSDALDATEREKFDAALQEAGLDVQTWPGQLEIEAWQLEDGPGQLKPLAQSTTSDAESLCQRKHAATGATVADATDKVASAQAPASAKSAPLSPVAVAAPAAANSAAAAAPALAAPAAPAPLAAAAPAAAPTPALQKGRPELAALDPEFP